MKVPQRIVGVTHRTGPGVKGLPCVCGFLDPGPRLVRTLDRLSAVVHPEATGR